MSTGQEGRHRFPHPLLLGLFGLILLVGVVMVVATCIAASREGPPAEAAIRKLLDDQADAWNRGDLDGFMVGYWNSPQLSFYSPKGKRSGWQETFDRYRAEYQSAGKEMGSLTFSELHIQMIGPDTALVRGRWQLQMKKDNPGGLFTLIVKRLPEGWRVVHDHTS